MKKEVFLWLLFFSCLWFYPADGKTWIQASDVKFKAGDTLEDYRDKSYLRTTVVATSDNFDYKVNLVGSKALVSVYCVRLHQSASIQKYYMNENGVFCYLNYTADLGLGGSPIAVFPSVTSDPKIWNINITNCSGEVILIEREIIK